MKSVVTASKRGKNTSKLFSKNWQFLFLGRIDLLLPHDPTLRMLRRGAEVCENMQSIIVTPDFGPHRVKPGRPSGT